MMLSNEKRILQFLKSRGSAPVSRTQILKATEIATPLLCRYMQRMEQKQLISRTPKNYCEVTKVSVFHYKAIL